MNIFILFLLAYVFVASGLYHHLRARSAVKPGSHRAGSLDGKSTAFIAARIAYQERYGLVSARI